MKTKIANIPVLLAIVLGLSFLSIDSFGQCTPHTVTASTTISWSTYLGGAAGGAWTTRYYELPGGSSGQIYLVKPQTTSDPDFDVLITDVSNNTLAFGVATFANPFTYTLPSTATIRVHLYNNTSCGTGSLVNMFMQTNAPCVGPTSASATPPSFCNPGSSVLTASGTSTTDNIDWYDAATGGTLVGSHASGGTLTVSPTSTKTYHAQRVPSTVTSQTFNYTGGFQSFTVPAGVTSVNISAFGAQGANAIDRLPTNADGGLGGSASGTLAVTPGQTLYINVGGAGVGATGGFNGGGNAGSANPGSACNNGDAGGGGGASDVRVTSNTLGNRVIVAGGGGGAGSDYCNGSCQPCGCGGAGGGAGGLIGTNGGAAFNCGFGYNGTGVNFGSGGAAASGGAGGPADGGGSNVGTAGTSGAGGIGSNGSYDVAGGGGGGGYFGGGGGGGAGNGSGVGGGGGGGGSSYLGTLTSFATQTGVRTGNGQVILTWNNPTTPCLTRTPVTVTVNPAATTATVTSNGPICFGSNAIYTISGGANETIAYTLTPGGTGTVTLNASGSGTVNAGAAPVGVPGSQIALNSATIGGCTLALSNGASVLVNALPTITASASAAAVCTTAAVTLTGGGAGTAGSYTWTDGTNTFTDGTPFIPTATATYTVTGTDGNACTATSAVTVTVNSCGPTASVIANGTGASTICAGQSANLKVTVTGGTSPYTVVVTDGASGTFTFTNYISGADIAVSPSSTSSYTIVSITDANSDAGSGNSGSATVTVNASPTITSSSGVHMLSGNSLTYTGSGTPNGTTPWAINNAFSTIAPSGNNVVITGVSTGISTITYTDNNGCTATKDVSVNPTCLNPSQQGPLLSIGTNIGDALGNTQTFNSYLAVSNIVQGLEYRATASGNNWLTITEGSPTGTIVAQGAANITFVATTNNNHYVHMDRNDCICTTCNTFGQVANLTLITGTAALANGTGASSICPGTSANLKVDILGGASPYTVTITDGTTPFTVTSYTSGSDIAVSPSSTSNYTIVSVTNAGSSTSYTSSGTATVTVNPLPPAPTVTNVANGICAGDNAEWLISNVNVGDIIDYRIVGNALPPNSLHLNVAVTVVPFPVTVITPTGNKRLRILKVVDGTTNCTSTWADNNSAPGTQINYREPIVTLYNASGPNLPSPSSVCTGSTIELQTTNEGNGTRVWSVNNSNLTGPVSFPNSSRATFTGATAGTSSIVTFLNHWGCDATHVVNVNALPTITPAGPSTICADNLNSTVQLAATPTGGTWSSTNTFATVDANGLVTGNASGAGAETITYTAPNSCTTTHTVNVNAIPVITATPVAPEHCLGDSVALTAADVTPVVTPSTQYFWNHGKPNGSFITSTNNTLYIVESIAANGCKSDPYNVTVQVNPLPTLSNVTGNTACENDASTTLSAVGGAGTGTLAYQWTGPSPATTPVGALATATIAPVALTDAGDYTITVTDAKTCSATATATLVVNTQPVITLVAPSTATICADGTTQLATTATGGTWASLAPTIASVDQNGLVSAQSTGAGPVDITYTDGNGCVGTFTVTLNALPVFTSPLVSPVCVGAPAQTLSMSNAPAAPIAWVSSMPSVASVTPDNLQTTSLAPLTAGASTITYTDINGCTVSETITVNSVAVISGGTTVCDGSTLQLMATTGPPAASPGGWQSINAVAASISPTGLVTGLSVGTTLIQYSDINGCAALPVIVTVNPVPTITSTVTDVCVNSTITLTASSATGTWSSSNANASVGATTGVVTGLIAGTADITYTDLNGCEVIQQVTINALPPVMAIATPNPACDGDVVSLTATPSFNYPPLPPVTVFSEDFTTTGPLANGPTILNNGCFNTSNPCTWGLIGWTSITSGADWEIDYNNTSSSSTGPNGGSSPTGVVTNGNEYAYLESSNGSGSDDLISPSIDLSTYSAPITLTFRSHMYGSNMGTLRVLVDDGTTTTQEFSTSGQQQFSPNANWTLRTVNLDAYAGQVVNLIFRAIDGPSFRSDMAIDNVEVTSSPAGPDGYTWTPGPLAGANQTVTPPLGTTVYTVTGTDGNGCSASSSVSVIVNPTPTITSTVSDVCVGDQITVTTSGTSGTWSSSNANATVDAAGVVTGVAGGTADIIYTDANGCQAIQSITINALPDVNVSATPDISCVGDLVQLNSSNASAALGYTLTNIAHAPVSPTGATSPGPTSDDQLITAAIPFSFDYYGTSYTSIGISSNGFISFDPAAGQGCCTGHVMPSTANPTGTVAFSWGDLNPPQGGNIDYFTTGIAPNRRMVIRYNNVAHYFNGPGLTGQIVLNESSNVIEIFGTNGSQPGRAATQGIQNVGGTLALPVPGRNGTVGWTMNNDGYSFAPILPYTPVWTTTGAAVSDPNIPNPTSNPLVTTTYTVTGTDGSTGCMNSASTTVTVNPLPIMTGPYVTCADPLVPLQLTANSPPFVTPAQEVPVFSEGFYAASSTTTAFVPNPNTPGWTSNGPGNWRSDYNGVSSSYGPPSGRTDAGYVYLDASYTGDDTLISPIIDLTAEVAPIDVRFYTFMYTVSGTIADLDLFVDNGPNTATSASLFNVSGNQQSSQSDPWDQRLVSLDAYAGQQIRLKFRGERGTSSITDIALDDVEVLTYSPATIANSWSSSDPLVATVDSNGLVAPVAGGTTDITFTDLNGCSTTETVTINDLPLVTAVADSNEICDGESTVLTASQTLGAAPIQWFWSHGQGNGATITPTGGSNINYTVFATDANGCSSIPVTIGVIVNPTPTITAADQTVCDGQGTATFVGIPAGGTPPYLTPTWAPNLTSTATAIIDNTPFTATLADAGDYVVTVEDAKGCLATDTATLFVDPLPAAPTAAAVSSPVCFGADAVFTITGVAGYDYEYNFDGGTTMTASIATGTTVNVTNPAPLTNTTLNITKVTNTLTGCITDLLITPVTAIVNVTLLPATPTITTNANTTTGNVCSLSTAIFTINGTNGDLVDWNTIGTGGAISGTATIGATGTVDVSVPGMVSTTNITLTQVTGTGGCFNTINVMASIGVDILPVLAVGATTPASCSPGCDGTAAITVSTAPAISSYSISPSVSAAMNGSIAENLCAATNYTITATDIYGCMGTVAHTGTLAPNPTVTATGDVICIGDQATLTAAGTNTAPTGPGFTYAWAGPAPGNANTSTANPYNLTPALSTEAGTYMVTATDAAGCTAQTTVTLTINELPSVTTVVTTQPSCIPGSDGVITATGAASTSPGSGASFTYALNPPSTFGPSNVFSSLSAGIYTIAVTDGNGCTNTISQTLNTANGPAVTSTNSPTICELDATTFTTVATPGLNPTLTYSYSPIPSSGPIVNGTAFTPLLSEAGAYIVTVTDGNGCTAVGLHALTINATPTITGSLVLCGGDIEQLTGSGTPAATNPWVSSDPLVATVDANGLVTATLLGGTTDITYRETANGITCDFTQTITVNVKPIIAGPTEVCRLADINLSATAAGTWSSLNMTVATVDATGKVTGVAAGMADIVLVDANGCSDTFTVTVNPLPEIMATAVPYEICAGDTTTLTAMNTVTSPSTAINFFWTHSGPNPSLQAPAFNTTYFVFASDANGCSSSSVSQLVQVNQLPTITASDVTICDGDLATLTATAANTSPTIGSVGIAWSGAFAPITNGLAFGPLLSQAGLYTATATDSKGCTNATTVNLFIDTLPTAPTLTSNSPICDGQDAVFTLTGVANDVVTYSINGGTPATATIGAGGTVDVTVTGVSVDQMISLTEVQSPATSCITPLSSTMTVTVQPLPTAATVAGNSPICSGFDAIFTISGTATDIVTYTINSSTAATATIGALGTVDVTVTAASVDQTILLSQVQNATTGCITPLTATTTVTVNALPNYTALSTPASPICAGTLISLTGQGGASAYNYYDAVWTPIAYGTPFAPVATATYTLVGTDNNGCRDTTTITVVVNPNPIAATVVGNGPLCDGQDAIFTISGTATDIVTYSINAGTPTTTTIGAGGTVDVTVTAASVDQTMTLSQVQDATTNCTTALTASMTVTVNPNPVVVTVASNSPICSGFDAVFTLTGTANDVVTYSINAGPSATATIGASGQVEVTVTAATIPQTITLSQVQSGTGCTTALTGTTTVTINPNPVISGNSVVCSNLPVQLSATNLPAASGAWMSSDTLIATVDNNGLVSTPGSGAVDIIYTDINGCIDRITITVNPLPIISATATPFEICYGDSSELTATTTLTSPTTAINFFWTHGLVNSSYLSPIANTTYFVYGTDANGCSSSSISQLVQVNQLPSITASDVTICVGASATLTATAASTAPTTGTPGIAWSGTFTPVNNGVAFIPAVADSGPYTATATDSKGCENSTTVNLTVNPLPAAPAITNNSPICDGSNAVFTLTGSVGDLVSYTINGASAAIATIGAGGTVDVTATGVSVDQTILLSQVQSGGTGCVTSLSATSTVTVNPNPTAPGGLAWNFAPNTLCAGDDATFIIYSATPGDIVTYSLDGGATTSTLTINPVGFTSVTDSGATSSPTIILTKIENPVTGCVTPLTDTLTIPVNPLPAVTATSSSLTVCAGDTLTLSGGGASMYGWDNNVMDSIAFVPTATNTYIVTGTDGNGCSATSSVTVTVNPLPVVTANATNTNPCAGDTIALNGGGASSYVWTGNIITPLLVDGVSFPALSGIYTVTGTDANGCSATSTVSVAVNALPAVAANATATDICDGDMVALAGSGAVPSGTYTWDNSVIDATPFSPAATNTYTVTGTDGNGCSATSSVTVTVNSIPVAPTVSVTHPICATDSGTINVSAPLGPNYEYSVDGINYQSSPNFTVLAGNYSVTVKDITSTASCPSLATMDTIQANATPCGPNVAVGAQSLPTSIAEGGTATINYFVSNVGTAPTSGVINIIISKPSNGTLTLTPPAGWTITLNTSGSVFLQSTNVIQPGLTNRVTIPAVYVHDSTNEDAVKSSNIKAQAGSGSEVITNDNEGQTFIQVN